jgi:hypothetical protein
MGGARDAFHPARQQVSDLIPPPDLASFSTTRRSNAVQVPPVECGCQERVWSMRVEIPGTSTRRMERVGIDR